jgi:hypothetical protein
MSITCLAQQDQPSPAGEDRLRRGGRKIYDNQRLSANLQTPKATPGSVMESTGGSALCSVVLAKTETLA